MKFYYKVSIFFIISLFIIFYGCDNTSQNMGSNNIKCPIKFKKPPYEYFKIEKDIKPVLNTPYWKKVKENNIIIGFTPDSPPFCKKIGDKINGFNYALAQIITRKLGIKFKYKIYPLKEQIKKLLEGDIDIILAPLTRNSKRAVKIAFSKPYYYVTQGVLLRRWYLFIPKDCAADSKCIGKKIENFFDLKYINNLIISVKQGSSNELLCRWVLQNNAKILSFKTNEEAVKALLDKKSMAMVADHTYIKVWEELHPEYQLDLVAVTGISTKDGLGIGIRKDDPDFLQWLNILIDELKGNAIIQDLENYYIKDLSWLKSKKGGKK